MWLPILQRIPCRSDFKWIRDLQAVFGETRVEGLKKLNDKYVYELIPWKKGEKYDNRLIEKARRILFETNLFSLIEFNNPGKVMPGVSCPLPFRSGSARRARFVWDLNTPPITVRGSTGAGPTETSSEWPRS